MTRREMGELLAAERAGRVLAALYRPRRGRPWRVRAVADGTGAALLAAARWADRAGARLEIEMSAGCGEHAACRTMAAILARMGVAMATAPGIRSNGIDGIASGRDLASATRTAGPDSAWSMPLAGNEMFVRPVAASDPVLSCAASRAVDDRATRLFAVPSLCLMENAAAGAVMAIRDLIALFRAPPGVFVAAGSGNNAGDGLAVARGLTAAGVDVTVGLFKDPDRLSPDAAANLSLLREWPRCRIVDLSRHPEATDRHLRNCGLAVDALLGTGFAGALSEPYRAAIERLNASGVPIVALDVPSGLSGDDGSVETAAVRAARTVTFANLKPGLLAGRGPEAAGAIYVAAIGAPGGALESPGS